MLVGGLEHVLFSMIYGMLSFPLTNSYFSRWLLHHQPACHEQVKRSSFNVLDEICVGLSQAREMIPYSGCRYCVTNRPFVRKGPHLRGILRGPKIHKKLEMGLDMFGSTFNIQPPNCIVFIAKMANVEGPFIHHF